MRWKEAEIRDEIYKLKCASKYASLSNNCKLSTRTYPKSYPIGDSGKTILFLAPVYLAAGRINYGLTNQIIPWAKVLQNSQSQSALPTCVNRKYGWQKNHPDL